MSSASDFGPLNDEFDGLDEPTLIMSDSSAVKREAQRSGRTLAGASGLSCQSSALERLSSDPIVLR